MSAIQHASLRAEILYLIGRSSAPLDCTELYEKCELADEISKVATALSNLKTDKKIVRVPGEGRARYKLAEGIPAPASAGKAGRRRVEDPDAAPAAPGPTAPAASAEMVAALKTSRPLAERGRGDAAKPGKKTEREKGKIEAAFHRAKKSTARDFAPSDAALADAIIARLKTDLGLMLRPSIGEQIEAEPGAVGMNIHVHIEQVDIHMGGL